MKKVEILDQYFVGQRFPYGEPSGMYRLVAGVEEGKDGTPVKILGNELYPCNEAIGLAEILKQNGVKPFGNHEIHELNDLSGT